MFGIGPPELIVIMVVALIIFGPERLPQIASQIGKAVRDFRQMSSDLTGEFNRTMQAADLTTSTTPPPQLNAPNETQESPPEVATAAAETSASTVDDAALRSAEEHSATGSYEAVAESPPSESDVPPPAPGEAPSDPAADHSEVPLPAPTDVVVFKPRATGDYSTRTASFASTPASFGGAISAPPPERGPVAVAPEMAAPAEGASDTEMPAAATATEQDRASTTSPMIWQYRPAPSPVIDPAAEVTIREKIEAQIAAEAFRERRRRATYSKSGRSA